MLKAWSKYLSEDIWRVSIDTLPRGAARRVVALRVVVLAMRRLKHSGGPYRASVLTLYALLSVVPALAVGTGLAKGFGLEEIFRRQIRAGLPADPRMAEAVVDYANALLSQAGQGIVAGVGAVALILTLVRLLTHVEYALNAVWGVSEPKPLQRRLADHVALIVAAPTFVVLAGGATVLLDTTLTRGIDRWELSQVGAVLLPAALRLFSFIVGWLLLSFAYVFLPNARVSLPSAVFGGGVAGVLYQTMQWLVVHFQIQVTREAAVYGGLALIPLAVAWMHAGWMIVLFGAALTLAHERHRDYEFQSDAESASRSARRRAAVLGVFHIARRFAAGDGPTSLGLLAAEMRAPRAVARMAVDDLSHAGIIAGAHMSGAAADTDVAFLPARPVSALSLGDVLMQLDRAGGERLPIGASAEWDAVQWRLDDVDEAVRTCASGGLLEAGAPPQAGAEVA